MPSWLPEPASLNITVEMLMAPAPSGAIIVSQASGARRRSFDSFDGTFTLKRGRMGSSVDRLTRQFEFCLQCRAIARITLAVQVLLLHDVKVNASWPEAFKIVML